MNAPAIGRPRTRPEAPRAERRRGLWLVLAALVTAGATAGSALRQHQSDPTAGFELATAKRGDIEDTVTALGKIQPRDYVDIGTQVSGLLRRVAVRPGDSVVAGALLAEIDPRLQLAKLDIDRALLAQLQADRAVQKLQIEYAAEQYERQQRMKEEGITRDDVFERARSEMRIATAKLDAIDAQIRQVQSTTKADDAQLGFTRIFAPIAGTVLSVDARQGQTLIASQQAPVLLRIADLSSMTVWAQVSEADIARLRPGMEVYFTTLGDSSRRWSARLKQLLPAPSKPLGVASASAAPAANNIVLYTALFDADNSSGELRPEMSAQVFFVVARAANAVVIPVSALRSESPGGAVVSVVEPGGSLETRAVKTGVRNRFDVQIVDGLAAGERVVTRAEGDVAESER